MKVILHSCGPEPTRRARLETTKTALELADGVLPARELVLRGLTRQRIQRLTRRGELVHLGRGLYSRPDAAVTAAGFFYQWGMFKSFLVRLEVGGLVLSEFQSFQLRYNRVSQPGVWTDAGTQTVFSPTLLLWTPSPVSEGEDYVFELTVTEAGGTVTVTTDAINVDYP